MEPDETTWIDTVPVRPARKKRITLGEYEWVKAESGEGEPAQLQARFWINSTECVAVLVETTTAASGVSTEQATNPPQPRVRIGSRSYLLFVEAPAQGSSA